MKELLPISALVIFSSMTVFNVLNYWQLYHVKAEPIPLALYAVWTAPIQIAAYFFLVLGIAWAYKSVGQDVWQAVFILALSSSVSKILPVYVISGKIPVKGDLLGLVLLVLAVISGYVWK